MFFAGRVGRIPDRNNDSFAYMLPTPTTVLLSMSNVFIGTLLFRDRLNNISALNSSVSGSGPRWLNNLCSVSGSAVHKTAPKRRGSVKRSDFPEESWSSKWSCLPGSIAESIILRLPDMPKWMIKKPALNLKSKYLPRLSILKIRFLGKSSTICWGIGHRSWGCLTTTCLTVLSITWGAIPRRVVSTSGNSGIQQFFFDL